MRRPSKMQAVGRLALADRVYEEIFASIVDGRLVAGAGISIDGVARDLTVSTTPVREALARLEATGLVLRVALKGYRVAPLFTKDELAELMDARLLIEPANVWRACQRATPELIHALEQANTELSNAPRGPAFAEFRDAWAADERFHNLIAEGGANKFILTAYRSLGGQIQRFRYFSEMGMADPDFLVEEHAVILAAFVAGDADKAREAMVAHIAGVTQRSMADVAGGM